MSTASGPWDDEGIDEDDPLGESREPHANERPDDAYDGYLDDPDSYRDDTPDPPEEYLIEEAERHAQIHRDQAHFGEECNCPPYIPPVCRPLGRLPRWSRRNGWHCGTEGGCAVWGYRSPWGAWHGHRGMHKAPF